MNALTLLERAEKASFPKREYTNMDRWLPVAVALRNKGCSWSQIYDWLKAQGEKVQENKGSFMSGMSRRHRNFIQNEARKAIAKNEHPITTA